MFLLKIALLLVSLGLFYLLPEKNYGVAKIVLVATICYIVVHGFWIRLSNIRLQGQCDKIQEEIEKGGEEDE